MHVYRRKESHHPSPQSPIIDKPATMHGKSKMQTSAEIRRLGRQVAELQGTLQLTAYRAGPSTINERI